KKIYSSLGMDFTEANTQLIEDWVLNNPQHKFGKHRYRAEDFGLDVPALRKRFAPYIRKYNIPEERDA
ncbi:MAG TPA: sulfotransferase, partial [Spirochaetota bacterium]|nr:sulfotransferase [Spirochaetota bacterium]